MINETLVKKYCRDDISNIENYEKALADTTQAWDCHHRLELTPDGEFAHSREDLKQLGLYYDRPCFELILLTRSEHMMLHHRSRSAETRKRLSESKKGENHPLYGKTRSVETRKKISESQKGKKRKPRSAETRKKISEAMTGKPHSDETRKKISEAMTGKPSPRKGKHWKIVDGHRVWY